MEPIHEFFLEYIPIILVKEGNTQIKFFQIFEFLKEKCNLFHLFLCSVTGYNNYYHQFS